MLEAISFILMMNKWKNIRKVAIMTTNRERINNMTNEELAHIFVGSNYIPICKYCVYDRRCDTDSSCYDGILQWLNQESEE